MCCIYMKFPNSHRRWDRCRKKFDSGLFLLRISLVFRGIHRVTYLTGTQKEEGIVKVIITQKEAIERQIWDEIMLMFGVSEEDELWENEEFILTEEQARKLNLLK